jgi:hypothetical protein
MADCAKCKTKADFCCYCDDGSEFEPQTNADRIRSMSDEELAEFFARRSPCNYYCNYKDISCMGIGCKQGILEWLKSEVKE